MTLTFGTHEASGTHLVVVTIYWHGGHLGHVTKTV